MAMRQMLPFCDLLRSFGSVKELMIQLEESGRDPFQ